MPGFTGCRATAEVRYWNDASIDPATCAQRMPTRWATDTRHSGNYDPLDRSSAQTRWQRYVPARPITRMAPAAHTESPRVQHTLRLSPFPSLQPLLGAGRDDDRSHCCPVDRVLDYDLVFPDG